MQFSGEAGRTVGSECLTPNKKKERQELREDDKENIEKNSRSTGNWR